jgi:hypothetical protein
MKTKKSTLTPKLRQNWWIDAALGIGAVVAILSSLYFLAYPVSGFQGGRNPQYDLRVILDRTEWDVLHTWSGVLMIFAALVHIIIHWDWIIGTAQRSWQVVTGKRNKFAGRLTYNIVLDLVTALSFIICALSSVYFLVLPASGPIGQVVIFNKATWDLIHTWSGIVFTMTAVLHFVLHWKWVSNITKKMFGSLFKKSQINESSPDLDPVQG